MVSNKKWQVRHEWLKNIFNSQEYQVWIKGWGVITESGDLKVGYMQLLNYIKLQYEYI